MNGESRPGGPGTAAAPGAAAATAAAESARTADFASGGPQICQRAVPAAACQALLSAGVHPVLARVYAARGVSQATDLEATLASLLPMDGFKGLPAAAALLADAIEAEARLLIIADYDADGATACAVGMLGLQWMGGQVDFLVPDRQRHGYGLTPAIVQEAALQEPDLLITVDNGIASVEGVAEAGSLGIPVLITDHHLPGPELPQAEAIVNPNQPGCDFPSKALAGVGVMFYLLLALRAELRTRGAFSPGGRPEPKLAELLDLVALGTVADVVPLDRNNRLLVAEGLKRMRAGRGRPGIEALFEVAGRDPRRATARDLGFSVGPRLNAAGRLTDMRLGILCLLAGNPSSARALATELDALNKARREIEADMREDALASLGSADVSAGWTVVAYDPAWHQGVIGIVAARLRDRFHRPAVVLAPGEEGELKGSGRSVPGLHLRDCLDLIAKREPALLLRFGGHAAAAGLTLKTEHLERFEAAFEAAAATLMSPEDLQETLWADGALTAAQLELDLAEALDTGVWGKDFPEPVFQGEFTVLDSRIVGEKHLKLRLGSERQVCEGILFGDTGPLPAKIRVLYQLAVNEWNGVRKPQLTIRRWEAC